MFKNFRNIIKKSIQSPGGKESSTRIATYIILLLVILFTLTFIAIEIMNAIETKTISKEGIIVLGMLLTHHLTLLGINKYNETKEKIGHPPNKTIK